MTTLASNLRHFTTASGLRPERAIFKNEPHDTDFVGLKIRTGQLVARLSAEFCGVSERVYLRQTPKTSYIKPPYHQPEARGLLGHPALSSSIRTKASETRLFRPYCEAGGWKLVRKRKGRAAGTKQSRLDSFAFFLLVPSDPA